MRLVSGSMIPSRAWTSRISPTTISRSGPNSMRRSTRHSSEAAASAMRGCFTILAGRGVRPARANSLAPSGISAADACIALAVSSSARLTTNSPVRRMFFSVCFIAPSERWLKLRMQSGGSSEITLKKENGAQLARPFSLQVETQEVGREIDVAVVANDLVFFRLALGGDLAGRRDDQRMAEHAEAIFESGLGRL